MSENRLSRIFSPYRNLSRPLWILFFVQVINRMGDFIAPFLTLLLTRRLGYSPVQAGIWVTLTVISGLFGIMIAGPLSDRFGRKPILSVGMGFSAVLIAAGGFFPQHSRIVWILVAMSFFQGMVRPAISALIADLTRPEERKDAFALSYLGINVGVAVGPMFAGFLFEHSLPWLFWIDALSSFAALFLIFAWIPTTCPIHFVDTDVPKESEGEKFHDGNALSAFFRLPLLVFFCFLLMLVNIIYSQIHFALPLYAETLFSEKGALVYGWLMSFNALTVVSVTPLAAHLTRRQRPQISLVWGSALYAAGFALMAAQLSLPLLFASTFIWTLGEIFFSINTGVYLASRTPRNFRGQFQSYREFISSLGRMAAPILGGLCISKFGIYAMWAAMAALGLLAALGFYRLDRADSR